MDSRVQFPDYTKHNFVKGSPILYFKHEGMRSHGSRHAFPCYVTVGDREGTFFEISKVP